MYQKLRSLCLSDCLQSAHPDWPFPFLFQGEELTRDILFLDPAIEYNVISLGDNPIRDISSLDYPDLNSWFHYSFFNGIAPIINSAETLALMPRLYRLKAALLESVIDSKLANYLRAEFNVEEPEKLVESTVNAISKLIAICSHQDLVIWGTRIDEESLKTHIAYIRKISGIPTGLLLELPHLRRFASQWRPVLAKEAARCRQSEAQFNKFKRRSRGLSSR